MPNLTVSFGNLAVNPLFWVAPISVLLFSFFYWRYHRENMSEEAVYRSSLLIVLITVFTGWLAAYLISRPLLGIYWGLVLAWYWQARVHQQDAWEGWDVLIIPWLILLSLWGAGLSLTKGGWASLVISGIGLVGLGLYWYLKKNYRSFAWYPSGRTGFLFWSLSCYSFSLLFGLAIWENNGLYWQRLTWLVSAVIAFGFWYHRSGRGKGELARLIKKRIYGKNSLPKKFS